MKKNIIFLAVGFIMISLCSFWMIYLSTQKPIKDSYVTNVHALYFSDEEIQDKNITFPGMIDYSLPKADTVFRGNKVRAFYGKVIEVIPYYVKNVDGNSYLQSNLIQIIVEKGYSGGYAKGKQVYIIDSGLKLRPEDVGRKGIFIPNNIGFELDDPSGRETLKADGELVPQEHRFLWEEQDHFQKIWNVWQVKSLWIKKRLVE